jgi:hypothetical protein
VIAQLAVEVGLEPRTPAAQQVQDLAHGVTSTFDV